MSILNRLQSWKTHSTLLACFKLFSKEDRIKVLGSLFIQIVVGALDLIGIALIGILGALAITGIQSGEPGDRVSQLLSVLGIDSLSFQQQTVIIAVLAVVILVFRTIVSILLTRITLRFIARKSAMLSSRLVADILAQSVEKIQAHSIQTTMYAVSNGVTAITLGIVGGSIALIADLALVSVMTAGLFLIDFLCRISERDIRNEISREYFDRLRHVCDSPSILSNGFRRRVSRNGN